MQKININNIPAVIYGESSNKVFLYIHGKSGYKEEALTLADIICPKGYQVLSFDLPEHGERKGSPEKLLPWTVVPEFKAVLGFAKQKWQSISLFANSIGAYISLLSFPEEKFKKCLFVSPIPDMKHLIENMMLWANVTPEQLFREEEIKTQFGETLSAEYYQYVSANPIENWQSKTAILYAGHDNLVERETITHIAEKFSCSLTIYENGEHWFHTDEQMEIRRKWIESEL